MKIRVRLFGALREVAPGGDDRAEVEIEMPEGGTAADLVGLLGIPDSRGVAVVIDGRVLAADETIRSGAPISVFRAIGGG
jgi:sulfur carrier protein ThiS